MTSRQSAYRSNYDYLFGVTLLTLIGLIVRLAYLDQPMRYDESYSYLFFVHVPLTSTLSDYSLPNQHMLNSLLMRASVAMFGNAPWALRLPAFIFGVALIPATYFALRRLFGSDAAFLAAALVTGSGPLILYSTNARGYSLIALLFLCVIAVSTRLDREEGSRPWFWLVILSVIGLYTIPIMLYAIGGVFAWHAARGWLRLRRDRDPSILKAVGHSLLGVVVLTCLLYLPVLIRMGAGPLIANDWVSSRTLPQFATELPAAMLGWWRSWHSGMPALVVAVLAAGLLCYAILPKARGSSLRLVASVLLWCIALLMVTLRPPFARVWLFLLPLYFGVASAGLAGLLERIAPDKKRPAILLGAFALCAWTTFAVTRSAVVLETDGPLFPDAEAVVAYLAAEVESGDGVYARTPADAPIWYYTWRRGLPDRMLRLKYNSDKRVLVVVNEADGQTIDQIVALTRLRDSEFERPVLRRRFKDARVYEVRRVSPPQGLAPASVGPF